MENNLHLYKVMNMFIPKKYYIFDVVSGFFFLQFSHGAIYTALWTLHILLLNKLMAMRGNENDPWN